MRASLRTLKKSSSSNQWLSRQSRDPYVNRTSPGGVTYRARSAHKLLSLAKSHPTLLSPGKMVVDLGAAPGGWSQVAAQLLRGRGMVWAVDVLGMEGIKGVELLRGDFLNGTVQEELRRRIEEYRQGVDGQVHGGSEHVGRVGVDTVLSDMMAPMSGVRLRDVQASLDLVGAATSFARQVLRQARPWEEATGVGRSKVHPGGNLVMKYFNHPDLNAFRKEQLEPRFGKIVVEKPKESRAESSEAYWVCLGFRGDP